VEAAERALHGLARCALRHGGLDQIGLEADGSAIAVHPVTPEAAPVLMREALRDFGAAVAARVVSALGGSVELADDRLVVRLPAA
jgi:hypothetical protein